MKNILTFVLCLVSFMSYSQQMTPEIRKDLELHKQFVDKFRVSDSLILEKTREINWLVMALACDHDELEAIKEMGLSDERIKITTDTIFARIGRLSRAYYKKGKLEHKDFVMRFSNEYKRVRTVHADYRLSIASDRIDGYMKILRGDSIDAATLKRQKARYVKSGAMRCL